ncbi:MAG: molybdopterin-guanine dinucleotide biosynthesis protein B [Spirochaetota bacterium]|nr:molybdopterin-guanine dinucleotide biosynthesis protein B [Spirochaetota bacterium]
MPSIIAIVGRSNSGKTTLIEKLIHYFNMKGKKLSIIKHMKHEFDIDYEGKDTFRYKEAGAFSSLITNDMMFAIVSKIDDNSTPLDLAHNYLNDSDLVIIEGFREGNIFKIEVIGNSEEKPLYISGVENIAAIVTDQTIETELPIFQRNDIENIGKFIEEYIMNNSA